MLALGSVVRATASVVLLAMLPSICCAADDWLDDMPSVAAVAQAVRDEIREWNNPKISSDPDYLATQLAGTFVLLRWFMLFEALRETNPATLDKTQPVREPNLSAQRRARMDAIATEYRQVELAIERGVGKRNGSDKKICDRKDTNLNRFGQKMSTPEVCHMERYRGGVDAVHIALAYRKAIFARLFCDKGPLYHERFHEYYMDGNGYRPPGRRPIRPHNFAIVVVKQWPEIAQPMTTAAVCAAHGGDANQDGLCDAWQKAVASAPTQCNTRISLTGVKVVDDSTIYVYFKRAGGSGTPTINIEVARFNPDTRMGRQIPVTVAGGRPAKAAIAIADSPLHSIEACRQSTWDRLLEWFDSPEKNVIPALDEALIVKSSSSAFAVDPAMPWLHVNLASSSERGTDDVAVCKQAVPVPTHDELQLMIKDRRLTGILGPYETADLAAIAMEPTARDYTAQSGTIYQREAGAWIVREVRSPNRYYLTIPQLGKWNFAGAATVDAETYARGVALSFDGSSCEVKDSYQFAGYYHTHPKATISFGRWARDEREFSVTDWKTAYCVRTDRSMSTFEWSYLMRVDRCIDAIDGRVPPPGAKARPVLICRP